jgi:hypothetical protein
MRRSLIVLVTAIFLILAAVMTLAAQGRGHFGGSRGFGSTPVVRPGPFVVARPPIAVAPGRGPSGFRPVHPIRPIRPVVIPPFYGYYSPYLWSAPIYGGAYSEYSSPYSAPAYSQPTYAGPDTQPPAVSQNDIDLAYQVGQLSAQVEQLRQQQGITSFTQPSAQQQAPAQRTTTPTVLVFRDGRRMEIQNYAIVGQTLWVLDEKLATKIPVSDLDVETTQQENHSRGMRFLAPEK